MLVPGRPRYSTALATFYGLIIINVLASVVTLVLMGYMWRRNTLQFNVYIKNVILMTIFQLTYDVSIYPAVHDCSAPSGEHVCTGLATVGFVGGGLGAAIFSCILIATAVFTIEKRRRFTKTETNLIFAAAFLMIIGYSIPYYLVGYAALPNGLVTYGHYLVTYNYVRLALIFLSLLILLRLLYMFYRLTEKGARKSSPIYHLLRKLVLYPIVQSVTRLGVTPYDLIYHSPFTTFPENAGSLQTFLCYFQVVLAPSAGMGAFFVFLYTQTGAMSELKRLFCCGSTSGATHPLGTSRSTENEILGLANRVSTTENRIHGKPTAAGSGVGQDSGIKRHLNLEHHISYNGDEEEEEEPNTEYLSHHTSNANAELPDLTSSAWPAGHDVRLSSSLPDDGRGSTTHRLSFLTESELVAEWMRSQQKDNIPPNTSSVIELELMESSVVNPVTRQP